ncbi:MAG TPA: 2-hydroxyacid dehydrogenase [Chthoniobacterales bacterium]
MRIAVFSAKPYDERFLKAPAADAGHELVFFAERLTAATAILAADFDGVCVFVNDQVDAAVLRTLAKNGLRLLLLRCAGFNNVDLVAAEELGIGVRRVPAYSPYAVAEHALALILTLNRKTHRAFNRVREGNFSLEGLVGFDIHGSTAGFIGTGKIGCLTAEPLAAMGCRVLGYDPYPAESFSKIGKYTSLETLLAESDIISLHCPLTPATRHLINRETLKLTKTGVMIINTSRGGLINTEDLIEALKSGKVGYVGLDVYEQEADVFFEDLSGEIIQDDVLQRLVTFPNVLITSHQAFFTETAMRNITATTLENIEDFLAGRSSASEVKAKKS